MATTLKKKAIRKPAFLMGFELEGGFPDHTNIDSIKPELRKIYNGNLNFHYDGSIRGMENTIEIVTPPLQEEEAKQKYFELTTKLKELKFITNTTCGLHVNVSAPVCAKYDIEAKKRFAFEFLKNLEVKKWRKKFKRENYTYCRNFIEPRDISDFDPSYYQGKSMAIYMKMGFNWDTVCPIKQRRIELRIAGNTNYHKKNKMVKNYLNDISKAMLKAHKFSMMKSNNN